MRRDTEKGKAYRENYLRRERRLDVNEFKSLKICPSAPSSKIPTLYYSEVQENEVFFKWTTKMLQENILNPSILTDISKTNNDQVCLWTSGLWMLHSCKFLPDNSFHLWSAAAGSNHWLQNRKRQSLSQIFPETFKCINILAEHCISI